MQILPSRYKVHKIYGQILIAENQKMGRKNFFGRFYLQGKNGFKGQKSVGQKPYKNFNQIIPPKGPKFKSLLKTDFTFIWSNPYNRTSENGS